jgi:hypothetical protein
MDFSSKEYAWKDVAVAFLGRPIVGLRGIEYKIKHQKEALFAAGRKARSIQTGKFEVEGTITLLQSEMIALNRAAKDAGYESAAEMEFDVIICYLPPDGILTTDKVIGVNITEIGHAIKVDDLYQEHALPFIAMDIEYNVV